MFKKLRNTAIIFLIISFALHLGIYIGVNGGFDFKNKRQKNADQIEMTFVDHRSKDMQQIVEQEHKQVNEEIPDDSNLMGKFNEKILKQTQAANSGAFHNGGAASRPTEKQKQAQEAAKTQPKPKFTAGTLPSLAALKPTMDFQKSNQENAQQQQNNAENSPSQSSDHIEKVETGMQTLLSTREFVYYSYYQRIREKIRSQWEPMIKEKVRKVFASGRSIASSHDRITQVIIVLNKEGSLIKVQVIGESGIKDLDDAAVDAFRAAEPFPNPPKGIVEQDGMIRIRWDFVLEAQIDSLPQKSFARQDEM